MRVTGVDWAARAAKYWKEVLIKWPRPPTWGVVWVVICGASLTGNLVLLWPRLTLLASSISEILLSLNIASRLSLLLSYLTPDLLSLLLARPHLYVLLNLILMRIVYRSGILSRPPPPPPSPPSPSPAPPAFPLNTYNKNQRVTHAIKPLPRRDHADQSIPAEYSHAITHSHSNSQPDPNPDLSPASLNPLHGTSNCSDHDHGAVLHPMDIVVDVAAKKETLQNIAGAVPQDVLSQEGLAMTINNDHDGDHHHHHPQLLSMKDIKKQPQQQLDYPDGAAVAAATARRPEQIMQNMMAEKKERTRDRRPSLFSIEPLSNSMSHDGDQLDINAQPHLDKKMTRSYTINSKATCNSPSSASSSPASFQRSASEARRSQSAAADHSNANGRVSNTHDDIESEASSLTLSADAYYDLSKEEFNATVETFISKFRKKLSMQRQDSVNRLLGLVKGRQ